MSDDCSSESLLWKAYCELGLMERHHGTLQGHYRVLASTWLLAALGAIGFVLSDEFVSPLFPKEWLVALMGFAAAAGIGLLWAIDLLVYQRLLDAAYIEGRSLESAQLWLPQVRNNIRHLLGGEGLVLIAWYYIVTAVVLTAIGGGALLVYAAHYWNAALLTLAGVSYTLVLLIVAFWMRERTSRTPSYEGNLFEDRRQAYETWSEEMTPHSCERCKALEKTRVPR